MFRQIHRRFLKAARSIRARHYHASDLYVLGAMAGAVRASQGSAWSYDARECYPHVSSTIGRPWVSWYWKQVEHKHIQGASAVFTVSDSIADYLASSYGIARPGVVHNVPEMVKFVPSDLIRRRIRALRENPEIPIVLHLGQLRKERGCEILVGAMKYVDGAHLVFLGSGPLLDALSAAARSDATADRVHFLDPVPPDEVLSAASGADIGVTLLQGTCLNHDFALPNKVFEYITAGIPVLASDLTELGRLLRQFPVGALVDGSDPVAVADQLNRMISNPGAHAGWRRAAAEARETFNWHVASQPFRDAFSPYGTTKAPRPD